MGICCLDMAMEIAVKPLYIRERWIEKLWWELDILIKMSN